MFKIKSKNAKRALAITAIAIMLLTAIVPAAVGMM